MWQMAERASYTPIDISAARYTQQAITSMSFDVSTGLYYGDVTHNYNNYYPIVRVSDLNTDYQ
jgi:hypothetical protein